jgi:hypothetical protein
MSLEERRRSGFGPAARLPAEIQDLLGIRFFYDLPEGPIRDSVEGYLAMPESKRGPNSIARRIVAEAVGRERERARRQRSSFGAVRGTAVQAAAEEGATIQLPPDALLPNDSRDHAESRGPSGTLDLPARAVPQGTEGPPPTPADGTVTIPVHNPTEGERPPTWFEFADAGVPAEGSLDLPLPEDSGPGHAFGAYRLHHARRDLQSVSTGWTTGFPELDRSGMRFVPGNLYMVEGPISAGKTSFLLEILRRHAIVAGHGRESSAPAVFLPGSEHPAEVYARLLHHEATTLAAGGDRPPELPRPAVHRWLRDGEALSDRDGVLLEAAARRLDQLIATGLITIANRDDAGSYGGDPIAWLEAATAGSAHPHSLIVIDDLHRWMAPPGPRTGSRRERTVELMSSLMGIAQGGRRGRDFAVAIVFSIATELNGHPGTVSMVDPGISAAEVRGIVRLAGPGDDGASRVTLAKNGSGPRGVTFPLDLARPAADRHGHSAPGSAPPAG